LSNHTPLTSALALAPTDTILISDKATQAITSLSPRQLARLEAEGRFPRSIRLGEGSNGRKARVLSEVLEWNRQRIANAEAADG
jgi:predicted DNA-binding transcriptional regulator AlpA